MTVLHGLEIKINLDFVVYKLDVTVGNLDFVTEVLLELFLFILPDAFTVLPSLFFALAPFIYRTSFTFVVRCLEWYARLLHSRLR